MPATINGIGTHYYGKKNRSSREGVCQACQKSSTLHSYDTRLWFVVVFIPVIPLGRKRIMDQCGLCQRHWVSKHRDWQVASEENVSGAREKFRSEPTVEHALEAHATMLSFHAHEEAREIRREALATLGESVELCMEFAAQLFHLGSPEDATPYFEQALRLDPDLPEARVGVALHHLNQGEADEAARLLDFMLKPGASEQHALAPLSVLASLYQQQGRYDDALLLMEHLLKEYPQLVKDHEFRKRVKQCEKGAARYESILPDPGGFSFRDLISKSSGRYSDGQRWLALGSIAAVLVMGGLVAHNEYVRRHRDVHVVNVLGQPVQVTVDDGQPLTVNAQSTLQLAEGTHHIRVAGLTDEEFDIQMQSGYFHRWTRTPVWVINIGAAAVFQKETLYYAVAPRPSDTELMIGEKFFAVPHADYVFTAAPEQLKVESQKAEVMRVAFNQVREPAADLFQYAMVLTEPAQALEFGESHLLATPNDQDLLNLYSTVVLSFDAAERGMRFLERGLETRPVQVGWHRAYQDLGRMTGREEELCERYVRALTHDQQNAALLYLCGRVTADRTESVKYYQQSAEKDPASPWPWRALAYDAASRGAWPECRQFLENISTADLDQAVTGMLHLARLSVGDLQGLEEDYRGQLAATSPEEAITTLTRLCDVFAVQNRPDAAQQAVNEWESRLTPQEHGSELVQLVRGIMRHQHGRFDEVADEQSSDSRGGAFLLFHQLAATQQPEKIAEDPAFEELLQVPWNVLTLSLAFARAGDADSADEWRETACNLLESLDSNSRRAADLLRATEPPDQVALDNVMLEVSEKLLLLTALAQRFDDQRPNLAGLARQLNVTRMPPYYLIQQIVGTQE